MPTASFALLEDPPRVRELDRLGDEIAELSAPLDAATARGLALIPDFHPCAGWRSRSHASDPPPAGARPRRPDRRPAVRRRVAELARGAGPGRRPRARSRRPRARSAA